MTNEQPLAVHESRDENHVVEYIQPENIPDKIQRWIWDAQLWGAYYEDGRIIYENIWGDVWSES